MILERKKEKITAVLNELDITPIRLKAGNNWYIEDCTGVTFCPVNHLEKHKRAIELLAKINNIPIKWFEDFRKWFESANSDFKNVELGNPVWYYAGNTDLSELLIPRNSEVSETFKKNNGTYFLLTKL